MSAIRFCITPTRNLPIFSYIFRDTEPLGTEFKTVACSVIGFLIFLEIQIRKEGTNNARYHQELGAMDAFTKSVMEEMVGLDQRGDKVTTKDFSF